MNSLDLNGFERYCKNINFVKSMNSYKNYIKKGIVVLTNISNVTLKEFYQEINNGNKDYLKQDFEDYISNEGLHQDLYSDFKSAFKKYMDFLNKKYSLSKEEIKNNYKKLYEEIKNGKKITGVETL